MRPFPSYHVRQAQYQSRDYCEVANGRDPTWAACTREAHCLALPCLAVRVSEVLRRVQAENERLVEQNRKTATQKVFFIEPDRSPLLFAAEARRPITRRAAVNTAMMRLVTYKGRPDLDVKTVAQNHFNLSEANFLKKVEALEMEIPVARLEDSSQKARRVVMLTDLAAYLDKKADQARRAIGL